jgi:CheY-like chemotaxis protein
MAHLLSFTDTRTQFASPKSALLIESDESLLNAFKTFLEKEGYAVRTAANSEEGLRLYRDFRPFNVVLVDYCVPSTDGEEIDYRDSEQRHGTALAMKIREISPSQGIIIAALDYRDAREVPRPPELMNVPLLVDISDFRLPLLLEKIEVDRAMEALTPSELLRLQRFADYRIKGLGRAAVGRTWGDLLGQAMLRTLIGAGSTKEGRHWNRHVDFVWHLTGAMRSISSSWKRQFKEKEREKKKRFQMKEPLLMSEVLNGDDGQEQSPLDAESGHISSGGLWAPDALADQCLIEKDEEDRVLAMVQDDPQATQVLQGLLDGLTKNEILSTYGLREKKYAAAVMRILKLTGRGNGGSKE